MTASQEGHVEVVDKLLQHGATVDLQSEVSLTPVQSLLTFSTNLIIPWPRSQPPSGRLHIQ